MRPNADSDPTYIGHRVIEGKDFSFSFPVFSDPKKNEVATRILETEKRPVLVDVIIAKADMREGKEPQEIVKETRR